MSWLRTLFVIVAIGGCSGAHRDYGNDVDSGTSDIATTCGSVTCDQVPANACVDQDTLRTYTASCVDNACSYPSSDVECGTAGCCGDHCCAIEPSNSDVFGFLAPTGLVVAPPNGTFDTDARCTTTSALGSCAVVPRPGLGEACVCKVDELVIGSLRVTGRRALVILASKSVDITTLLDVSGDLGTDGPGASKRYASAQSGQLAGVGGSYQTAGGGASGNTAAPTYGDPTSVPLLGGMRGQPSYGAGGGGGGAVQITAGERISVPGVINAGGGGGVAGSGSYAYSGAGGGGSGGAILLEAPVVTVTGSAVANGGGGGGGGGANGGTAGSGGNASVTSGYGGAGNDGAGCPLYGYVSGGDGGSGAYGAGVGVSGQLGAFDSRCIGPAAFVGDGGGGGGVGRIRVNTKTGCQCNGTFSPSASFGMVTAR